MPLERTERNLLANAVTAARRLLADDIVQQLKETYGIHEDETVPMERLGHLTPDQQDSAAALRELVEHHAAAIPGKADERRRGGYARTVLEIAFTTLNRFAAIRMCEERELIAPSLREGLSSDGYRLFESLAHDQLGGRHETYRAYLQLLFDELAVDLGVLFDRSSPQSAIFPRERCLEELLRILNQEGLRPLWSDDETIGWIYQYFNPPEERKAMRDASSTPRTSRELAVRNQFFTPRYVVEFLVDNTLGRIWWEMRKGETVLKKDCRYLVRRPNEIFLSPGEAAPVFEGDDADLSREELLRQPVYTEPRSKKDPRDLRVLDPACGSGHFLLYAFDLLGRMFEEAWADPASPVSEVTGRTLAEDFETLDELRRQVPKLIVEHNLHGIDIDPRAVQIAALALWLRAQKGWKNIGLKADGRPRIAKSNIVAAEPMPGEEDMRREFTDGLKPRVLGQILDEVFEKMRLAGEAGSLLKIDEEIKDAVAEAGKQWREGPKPEVQLLFPGMADTRPRQQELRFDVKGITEARFWCQAEDRILDALREYAARADNGHAIRRRLFAEDAARGFAFIDLCRKRYDVVLMNPPFGVATPSVFALLKRKMPSTYTELYAAFVDAALQLVRSDGRVGAITSRAFLYINRLAAFRRHSLASRIDVIMDLGANVMDDAMVEACAYTISPSHRFDRVVAFDVRGHSNRASLHEILDHEQAQYSCDVYVVPWRCLATLPSDKFLYYLPVELSRLLREQSVFEPDIGTVRQGMGTFDDFRFVHLLWEVPRCSIGEGRAWEPFAKGGPFAKYYSAIHLAVKWSKDGAELCEINMLRNGQTAQVRQASDYWRLGGCTYSKRSARGFSARALPKGCIMAGNGPAIISQSHISDQYILGWLNSRLITSLVELQANAFEFNTGILKGLPWRSPDHMEHARIAELSFGAAISARTLHRLDETGQYFTFCPVPAKSLLEQVDDALEQDRELVEDIAGRDRSVTLEIDKLYGVDSSVLLGLSDDGDVPGSDDDDNEGCSSGGEFPGDYCAFVLSGCVGVVLGRWDIRMAGDPSLAPRLPEPFAALPICSPGMLIGADGRPAEPNLIVSEEWLRARPDANTLPPKGSVTAPFIQDAGYPLRVAWNGVLVDDPGFNGKGPHREDIVRRVREVFDLLWKEKAHDIERVACDILGLTDVREYFRKPTGFFQDHLKRYSKSRRKAPIYWPLSTKLGSYTLWIYYHRLDGDLLFRAVNEFVNPKIHDVEASLESRTTELDGAAGRAAADVRRSLESLQELRDELLEFRDELLRVANLPYRPNLDDGVLINAAPLWRLFRLPKWRGECEACWKDRVPSASLRDFDVATV